MKASGHFASRKCLTLLKWLSLINSTSLDQLDQKDKQLLLKCHSIIVSLISEINYTSHYYLLKNYLYKFIDQQFSVVKYIQELVALTSDHASAENPVFIFNLWEFVFAKLNDSNPELIKENKSYPIDLLIKYIICSKVRIPKERFFRHSHLAIKNIDHSQFKNDILPAIQKSVLRSAETALPVIDHLIQHLDTDLSDFVEAISKLISNQLYGKEDYLRLLSINCYKNLSIKSTKKESNQLMLKSLVSIYNGSDGKLTLPAQKLGVLSAIGCLSESSNFDDKLVENICLDLISFMKNEIHEPTLIECLNQTSKWSSKFSSKLPSTFLDQIKAAFTNKSTTPLVKAMLYLVLRSSANKDSVSQLKEFNNLISSSITTGLKANMAQHTLISESLFASTLVLKLNQLDQNYLKENVQLAELLTKVDKLTFLSDKYLAVCSTECYYEILNFTRLLLESNLKDKLDDNELSLVFNSLVHLLNFKSDYQIRSVAIALFKEFFTGSKFDDQATNKYVKLMINCFLKLYSTLDKDDDSSIVDDNNLKKPSSSSLMQCIKVFASIRKPLEDLSNYNHLKDLFIACHIPLIYSTRNPLWLKVLNKYLGVENVHVFLEENLHNLVNLAYSGSSNIKIQENSIKTLVSNYPQLFLPVLFKNISNSLRKQDLKSVSKIEYEIFRTPEGELYDLSVIGSNADQFNVKNLKKENKLYSYKEQLEVIELRKEMLAKKKNVELTKKQQEAKAIQLVKESEIRKKVEELNNEFEISIIRLNTIIDGNPLFTSFYLKDLIPLLIDLFQSHLCAKRSIDTFLSLSKCVLDKRSAINYLVKSISYAILRQYEPFWEIDDNWTVFDLAEVESNLFNQLYNQTCSSSNDATIDDELNETTLALDDQSKVLRPTTFAYIFPFISNLIVKQNRLDDNFDKLLNLISKHVTIDFDEVINELDDLAKNPIYLPRKDLCQLLLKIIEEKSIMVAKKANKVFSQLSKCLANYTDNDEENLDEIYEIVINNLNSDNELIRIACLNNLNDQLEHLLDRQDNKKLFDNLFKSIWISKFDLNKECETKANEFWLNFSMNTTPDLCDLIIDDILTYKYELLEPVSNSIAKLLNEFNSKAKLVFDRLSMIYKEIAPESIPTVDEFGRPLNRKIEDNFIPRLGIALVLTKSAPYISDEIIKTVADFLVNLALKDVNDQVRKQMQAFGIALINKTEKENLHSLLKVFQKHLEEIDNSKETDKIRASIVVLLGTLAARLDKNDPYIKQIIVKLIETLSTPSQMVQESVSFCLPSLVPAIKDEIPTLIENLFKLLLDSDNYGEKKGKFLFS